MKKIALILTLALFIASCGKKDETQTTTPQDQQQLTQQQTQHQTQQQTQQQTTDQNKLDEQKKEEEKKENEMKKEDDKKKETEQKSTKDESIKTTDENPNADNKTFSKSDMDFSQIYAKRCAKCHGKDLKGKPDGGPDLTRSETQNKSDSKLFNIISNGVKADNEDEEDMPAFKGKLSEDEIKSAIEYIKSH